MKKFWVLCSIMLVFAKGLLGFTLQPLVVCEPFPQVVFVSSEPLTDCKIILKDNILNYSIIQSVNYTLPSPQILNLGGQQYYFYSFNPADVPQLQNTNILPLKGYRLLVGPPNLPFNSVTGYYYYSDYMYDPTGAFGAMVTCDYIRDFVENIEVAFPNISPNELTTLVDLHLETILFDSYSVNYSQIQNCLPLENQLNIFAAKRCCQVFNPNRLYCSECNENDE